VSSHPTRVEDVCVGLPVRKVRSWSAIRLAGLQGHEPELGMRSGVGGTGPFYADGIRMPR
jgi:hypothetical protein